MFEKLLKLKHLMLTKSGKEIAEYRSNVMINFLKNYLLEENNDEESNWTEYLNNYIEKNK